MLTLCCLCGASAADLPPVETVKSPSAAYMRNREVAAKTEGLLETHDTAGLEALAARLRQSHESDDAGKWLLTTFYDHAVYVPDDEAGEREAMAFYEKWARDRPDSITAQVCYADALTDFAWNARGNGWGNSVTEEGGKLFRERLDQAWEVLQAAAKLPEKCPGWFSVAQTVALGQGWKREEYMIMMSEALKREPTYGYYYTQACYWLLPRWYGERGDFEKWLSDQADTYPPAQRDLQYARFVWLADRLEMNDEMVFAPGRLDWDRVKRGFEAWSMQEPDNFVRQSEFLKLALLANDRKTARAIFDATKGKFFPPFWGGKISRFEQARRFAYEGASNLFRAAGKSAASQNRLTPEVVARVQWFVKLAVGFLGGLLAGVLLFALAMQRQQIGAGVLALLGCLLLAVPFGTMATLIPGAALWFYLRRRASPPIPEERPALSGWLVLLWVIVLSGLYLGLQIVATVFVVVPQFLGGTPSKTTITDALFSEGTAFLIALSSLWIVFLGLVTICRPQGREGWRACLGLQAFALRPTLLWTGGAAIIVLGLDWALHAIADDRTRAAEQLMAQGVNSPILFFLAVVLAAPIVEELLFRGFAYSGWINKLGFPLTALILSTIFASLHIQYGWVGLLDIFCMGFILATLRWKTGSVFPCIALHMLNNFASVLGVYLTIQAS